MVNCKCIRGRSVERYENAHPDAWEVQRQGGSDRMPWVRCNLWLHKTDKRRWLRVIRLLRRYETRLQLPNTEPAMIYILSVGRSMCYCIILVRLKEIKSISVTVAPRCGHVHTLLCIHLLQLSNWTHVRFCHGVRPWNGTGTSDPCL